MLSKQISRLKATAAGEKFTSISLENATPAKYTFFFFFFYLLLPTLKALPDCKLKLSRLSFISTTDCVALSRILSC